MKALQYLHSNQSGKERREYREKNFWERVERIAKVAAQFAATLVPLGGLLGVCAVVIGRAYISAYYQAKGIPTGLLPFKAPENKFVGWIYLTFTMSDLVFALACVSGLTGLVTIVLIMPFSRLHGCAKRQNSAHFILLLMMLGSIVIISLSLYGKLALPWWAYYLVISAGLAGFITRQLLCFNQEEDAVFKKFVVVSGILLGISLLIITFLWVIASAMAEAQTRGWENGCASVTQSPEIIFTLSSENPDIQEFLPIISQGEKSPKLYKGRLLLQTEESYYVFTATITTTNPFTENLRLFPSEVLTQCCSPAQVIVLPTTDVHIVKLIPRYEPASLCGQTIRP